MYRRKNIDELAEALRKIIADPEAYKPNLLLLHQKFSYEGYKQKIVEMLNEMLPKTAILNYTLKVNHALN